MTDPIEIKYRGKVYVIPFIKKRKNCYRYADRHAGKVDGMKVEFYSNATSAWDRKTDTDVSYTNYSCRVTSVGSTFCGGTHYGKPDTGNAQFAFDQALLLAKNELENLIKAWSDKVHNE